MTPLSALDMHLVRIAVSSTCLTLAGCFPVYKTLQPAATATVLDTARSPVAGAEVQLISNAYPYGWEKGRQVRTTDAAGKVRFDSLREWRTEVLMIHGWESYFWNWCVRRDGYATFITEHRSDQAFENDLVVQLSPGESTPCPKALR